jgi:hypothetical protein
MSVNIGEMTSHVIADGEPEAGAGDESAPTARELARARVARCQLERDAARTRAEDFDD